MDTKESLQDRIESIAGPPPPPKLEEMAQYINEHSDSYTAGVQPEGWYTDRRTCEPRGFFRRPVHVMQKEWMQAKAFIVVDSNGETVVKFLHPEPELLTPQIARWILNNVG